jgi:RNA polymerase sigma factor (sigma-70 family)
MTSDELFAPQIDGLETRWSLLRRAHLDQGVEAVEARNFLVLRYAGAIRGYVQALTRHDADADELAQTILVKLIEGDFGAADPNRGRFRDLLKVAIRNLVRNHWDKHNRRQRIDRHLAETTPQESAEAPEAESVWNDKCRETLIENAMSRLERLQQEQPQSIDYHVLRLRSSFPEDDSTSLAAKLSELIGRTVNAAAYRQQLKRARQRFAEFIIEDITQGLDQPSPNRVQEELIDVGLYEYIRDVLPPNWGG